MRLLAGMTALCTLLSGCASLLNREYVSVTTHNMAPTAEGDSSTLRAESYQELVNALLYFITQGTEEGSIRLYVDAEDVEADLEAACLEVVQEDPLGAYAVEFIKYSVSSVVTYCEADVQITYRRTKEQIDSIVSATGTSAIRGELEEALAAFATECVLRISYFSGDTDYILDLMRQAYYANPSAALGMPEATVSLYPDSGQQRIVEVVLSYPLELPELKRRQALAEQEAEQLSRQAAPHTEIRSQILTAGQAVLNAGGYVPDGGSTAYHALLTGGADSEGLALAMALVCQYLDIPCQVVQGTQAGEPHFWNVVSLGEFWRHLDLTGWGQQNQSLFTDEAFQTAGYTWDTALVPQCRTFDTTVEGN